MDSDMAVSISWGGPVCWCPYNKRPTILRST